MAKTTAQTSFTTRIHDIIARAAAEIAHAAQSEIRGDLRKILDGVKTATPKLTAAKPKAAPAPAAKPGRAPSRKGSSFLRRSAKKIAADNGALLGFIKANPGLRSEQIQKATGLARANVASGLQRLRDDRKVRMTGVKRAATYAA